MRIWGRELPLITAIGVFAADGPNRGTAVLLRAYRYHRGHHGSWISAAGTARLALAVAVHCPGALVDAVDVNGGRLRLSGQCAGARCGGPRTQRCGRTRLILKRATTGLVQPSDPNRQAGSA